MAPISSLLTASFLVASACAFSPSSPTTTTTTTTASIRHASTTRLYENFGFSFAEDQVENTPQLILGEANYKKWLNSVDPNNMLNRQVSCFGALFFFFTILLAGIAIRGVCSTWSDCTAPWH